MQKIGRDFKATVITFGFLSGPLQPWLELNRCFINFSEKLIFGLTPVEPSGDKTAF